MLEAARTPRSSHRLYDEPERRSRLYAAMGRARPLNVRSPTGVACTSCSTALNTRRLTRIWPAFAASQRRAAKFGTVPITEFSARRSKPMLPSVAVPHEIPTPKPSL